MKNSVVVPVLDPWRLVVRTILLLLLLVGIALALILLDLPLEEVADRAVRRGGLPGIFLFVWVVDTFTVPASLDVVFPLTVRWAPVPLLSVMSIASVLGGICGYWIGRALGRLTFVRRTVAGYYARGLRIVTHYGVWSVVLAAVTPLPFSTVSWIAGMVKLPFRSYVLAALLRVPRIVVYWALLRLGVGLFS